MIVREKRLRRKKLTRRLGLCAGRPGGKATLRPAVVLR